VCHGCCALQSRPGHHACCFVVSTKIADLETEPKNRPPLKEETIQGPKSHGERSWNTKVPSPVYVGLVVSQNVSPLMQVPQIILAKCNTTCELIVDAASLDGPEEPHRDLRIKSNLPKDIITLICVHCLLSSCLICNGKCKSMCKFAGLLEHRPESNINIPVPCWWFSSVL
jgi:hypothetical protein